MKEVITTPDGMKLTARYRVRYQDRWLKKDGRCMFVINPKNARKHFAVQNLFDSETEAMQALADLLRQCNKGARIETTSLGAISIDLVISEEDAKDSQIIWYKIEKQWCSDWEKVEEARIHPAENA